MTRSSQPIHKHIRDFDDDFERTLRRRRNQQESNPLNLEPNLEEQVPKEEEIPTAQVGEVVQDMAMDNRTLKELAASGLDNAAPLCIQYPTATQGKTEEFELKSSLLHHIPKYHGLSMEDLNKHLKEFEVMCSSMTPVNVDGSILKMKAFPFSLMDKAKDWLYELAPGTVTTWESMKRAFLEKFFPTSRIILLRKKISGIQQDEGESFPTYYERFKSLVASCPQHQMKEELLLQYFYEGLLPLERQMLDASAGGALVDKTPLAAKILIANRALNAQQYEGVGQRGPPRQQVHEGQENQTKAMQSQDKRVDQLEKQIGQIAEFVSKFRDPGQLPSSTIPNPKGGYESAKAILLRSGKEVGAGPKPSTSGLKEDKKLQFEEEDTSPPTTKVDTSLPQASIGPNLSNSANQGKNMLNSIPTNVFPSNVPFPSRFLQSKNEEEEKDVLKTFRKVHVNIPLLDAIKQILKYAKCLKKLCTTKKCVREKEVVHVSEKVSAILQRKLPSKCKDPGSFTIPCVIGNTRFESAMLDLGASINVMPYSIYASMKLGVLKNDGVIIQLADRSNAYPKGVLEDVLVQVNHLIFPADFYVLEMDKSDHAPSLPILLGRPFMKTAQTKIDVAKGLVTMAFDGDMISFKISESIETPNVVHSCCAIDKIEKIGPDHSALGTKDASRTMQNEGIGVEHKDHMATALKMLKLAERTMGKNVHIAATSSQHIGKPPNPNLIPIKVDRWFPSLVQVPKQIPDGGRMNMNLRQHNAPINKHHYPFPFKDVIYENFVEHVVEDIPLHVVGSYG
ncbi:unnamed protein product [Malus baccata var. baccata]